jgi:hypothetical protein
MLAHWNTGSRLLLGIATCTLLIPWPAVAQEGREDCDAYYFGIGRAQDFQRAFACEQRRPEEQKDWARLCVMYMNGEGTPRDIKKARAAFRHIHARDASTAALQDALERRETNPKAPLPRVDYCKEIAQTTLDGNYCGTIAQRLAGVTAKDALKNAGKSLTGPAAKRFDELTRVFASFRKADGQRLYADFSEGSIRNEMAMNQENLVQRDFLAAVKAWGPEGGPPPAAKRPLGEADQELNKVYRESMRGYDQEAELDKGRAEELQAAKTATRDAQRLWLKYAAAWAKFAEAQRPEHPATDDLRAYLIEQRIRELQTGGEQGFQKE